MNTSMESQLGLVEDIAFFRALAANRLIRDSAGHLQDLNELSERAMQLLVRQNDLERGVGQIVLAVVGSFSAGKSCFINSLLGEEVCPVDVAPTTSCITRFMYSDTPRIIQVEAGRQVEINQEEYVARVRHGGSGSGEGTLQFEYFYPFEGLREITIIDTPGFENPKNERDEQVTLQCAQSADALFFVLDINKGGVSNSVLSILNILRKAGDAHSWHFIANKADLKPREEAEEVLSSIQKQCGQDFKSYQLYSSTLALEKNRDPMNVCLLDLGGHLRELVERREVFSLQISGSEHRGTYGIQWDKKTYCMEEIDYQYMTSREQLLRFLSQLKKVKEQILQARQASLFKHYRDDLELSITRIMQSLVVNKLSGKVEISPDDLFLEMSRILEYIEEELSKKIYEIISNALDSSIKTIEVDKKEKDYTFYAWVKLILDFDFFEREVSKQIVWRYIEKQLQDIEKKLLFTYGHTLDYSSKINTLPTLSTKLLREEFLVNSTDYYHDKKIGEIERGKFLEKTCNKISFEIIHIIEKILQDLKTQITHHSGRLIEKVHIQREDMEKAMDLIQPFLVRKGFNYDMNSSHHSIQEVFE